MAVRLGLDGQWENGIMLAAIDGNGIEPSVSTNSLFYYNYSQYKLMGVAHVDLISL